MSDLHSGLFEKVYAGKCLNCWTNRGNYLGRWYVVARGSDYETDGKPVLLTFNGVDGTSCSNRTTTEDHVADMLDHAQEVDVVEFSELPVAVRSSNAVRNRGELVS